MKIENFHCTISIYPDLPWFHTWTSHTGPATFASITALLCNINISLLTTVYAQHQHTSGHQPALMAVSQRKLLYGTAQLHTSSLKHVRRWICHWSRDAAPGSTLETEWLPVLSASAEKHSIKYAPLIVVPVAFWNPVGMYYPQKQYGVSNNQYPAEWKLSSERY